MMTATSGWSLFGIRDSLGIQKYKRPSAPGPSAYPGAPFPPFELRENGDMTLWRTIGVLILAACASMAAQAPATTQPLHVPVTEFTLPNGLHVILHRDTSVPVVEVNIWYHVGSA